MTFDSPDLLLLYDLIKIPGSLWISIIMESPLPVVEYIKARKELQVQHLLKMNVLQFNYSPSFFFLFFQMFGPHTTNMCQLTIIIFFSYNVS